MVVLLYPRKLKLKHTPAGKKPTQHGAGENTTQVQVTPSLGEERSARETHEYRSSGEQRRHEDRRVHLEDQVD